MSQSSSLPDWFPGYRKHSSQPNDDGTSGQDCVEARREFPPRPASAAPTFMWNDRGCREHNYFVCERPSIEGKETRIIIITITKLFWFKNETTEPILI